MFDLLLWNQTLAAQAGLGHFPLKGIDVQRALFLVKDNEATKRWGDTQYHRRVTDVRQLGHRHVTDASQIWQRQ